MDNWIQLKDGIAFAYVQSNNPVENSILIDSNTDPKNIMGKKLEDGEWVQAETIYFVEEFLENKVLRIGSTIFPSDVNGTICPSNVRAYWRMNEDGTFSEPESIAEATIYDEVLFSPEDPA